MKLFQNSISIVMCIVLANAIVNALPTVQKLLETEDSRNYNSMESSGFVPIIPSHLSPIYAYQNFFASFYHSTPSTSKPFAIQHVSSTLPRFETTTIQYDESFLGSGDFTVINGGSFNGESDGKGYTSEFSDVNNSRSFAQQLKTQHHNSKDPFVNFKDFADITSGVDTDFSQLVTVYLNKNLTKYEPRNILEQLQSIDHEKYQTEVNESIKSSAALSKFKTNSKFKKNT